jgi:hypothetical protein
MSLGAGAPLAAHRCRNHPDREGIGVCVRCRSVVCVECTTKVDRMNFCTSCLASLSPPARRRAEGGLGAALAAGNRVVGAAVLAASAAALAGLFAALGLVLATWGSAR